MAGLLFNYYGLWKFPVGLSIVVVSDCGCNLDLWLNELGPDNTYHFSDAVLDG